MSAYITTLADRGVPTVLLRAGAQVFYAADPVAVVRLPATVEELLPAGGLGALGGSASGRILTRGGTVQEPKPPGPMGPGRPWTDDETGRLRGSAG